MRPSRRNNILAGSFLIASLVLGVAVSAVLSDIGDRFVPKNTYVVRFALTDGVSGIVPGSTVLIGGREAGHVSKVGFANTDGSNPDLPAMVELEIRLPKSIVLYENAVPTLSSPLIGSMSSINLVDLGSPTGVPEIQGASSVLEPGEALRGRLAPPSFLAASGFGPEETEAVKRIISRIEETVGRFDDLTIDMDEKLRRMIDDIAVATDDIMIIVEDIRKREPEWADRVDSALANLDSAAEQANQVMADVREGVAEARDALDVNRPKIDRIVDNLESTTTRLDTETMDQISETLTGVDEGVEDLQGLITDARTMLAERAPEIRRTLSNVRLASDQLRLTLIEVRRNPWRLLYRPGAKETRTEVLYDAARSYAAAVSDLRAASESLEIATAREKPNTEEVQRLLESLRESLSRFETTEQQLLDRLLQE